MRSSVNTAQFCLGENPGLKSNKSLVNDEKQRSPMRVL